MNVSRRSVLGGALAAPVLATAATAADADTSGVTGRGEDGWIEILWTPPAKTEIDRLGITMEPIAPATSVKRNGRLGMRFPLHSVQGDPSSPNPARAQGTGAAAGGFVFRHDFTEVRVTRLEGVIRDERMSGRYMVNGVETGVQPMFRWRAEEGDLSVVPGALGEPVSMKVSDLPVRMTPEMLDLITASAARRYDFSGISADTVVAHVTALGRFIRR